MTKSKSKSKSNVGNKSTTSWPFILSSICCPCICCICCFCCLWLIAGDKDEDTEGFEVDNTCDGAIDNWVFWLIIIVSLLILGGWVDHTSRNPRGKSGGGKIHIDANTCKQTK